MQACGQLLEYNVSQLAEGRVAGGLASGLGTLAHHLGGLVATESSTPLAASLLVLVGARGVSVSYSSKKINPDSQVGLCSRDEGSKVALVLGPNLLDGDDGSALLVHNGTKTSLALHDNVGDTHLAAQSGEVDNELNGVDIVGNDDERSLLGLDERNDVVQAVLGEQGLLVRLDLLVLGGGSSSSVETGLLLLLGLGAVLVEELEELGRGVLVEGVRELGDGRGHLEALVEDDLLALQADVFGPLDEAGQVTDGLDVLACCLESVSRCPSSLPRIDAPMPKFLGVASKRGFFLALAALLAPKGAAAGFLVPVFLGAWSLRRNQQLALDKEVNVEFRSSNVVHGMQRPRQRARFIARRVYD